MQATSPSSLVHAQAAASLPSIGASVVPNQNQPELEAVEEDPVEDPVEEEEAEEAEDETDDPQPDRLGFNGELSMGQGRLGDKSDHESSSDGTSPEEQLGADGYVAGDSPQASGVNTDIEEAINRAGGPMGSGYSVVIRPSSQAVRGQASMDRIRDSIVRDALGDIVSSWTNAGWDGESEFADNFNKAFNSDKQIIVVARNVGAEFETRLVEELNERLASESFIALSVASTSKPQRRLRVGDRVRASPSADESRCLGAHGSGSTGVITRDDSSSLPFHVECSQNSSTNWYTQEQLELVSASMFTSNTSLLQSSL